MKKKHIFLIILALLAAILLGLYIWDACVHPLKGDPCGLLKIDAKTVTSVQITHNGWTAKVTDPEAVAKLLEDFDMQLTRGGSDYFAHIAGGDWSIRFITAEGTEQSFLFFASDAMHEDHMPRIKVGHYYYTGDRHLTAAYLQELWDLEYGNMK